MIVKRTLAALALFFFLMPVFADHKAVSDDEIFDQVHLKLASDPNVRGTNIAIEVHNGVVTLKGSVDGPHERSKAEKLVKKVKGVQSVDNQLKYAGS